MIDPEGTELVKAVAEGAAEGSMRAALEKLDPFVEGSAMLGDLVRFVRWRVQLKILGKAEAILKERGLEPQAVPLKVLVPLLERSSLEDENDEEMVTRWAALLANAAGGGAEVLPSFPAILSELSSEEARILDHLYAQGEHPALGVPDIVALQETLGEKDEDLYAARYFNLARLDLCDVHMGTEPREDQSRVLRPHFVQWTALGFAFMRACTDPSGARSGAQSS